MVFINLVAKLESSCSYLDHINALFFSIYFINVQRNTFYVHITKNGKKGSFRSHDTKSVCFILKLNLTFCQNLLRFKFFPKILQIHVSKYSFRVTP